MGILLMEWEEEKLARDKYQIEEVSRKTYLIA